MDFTAEVERSLRVTRRCGAVFCAVGKVQPQSETVWRQAKKYHTPIIAFVNKMDRTGADFQLTVDDMRNKLGVTAVPIQLRSARKPTSRALSTLSTTKLFSFDGDELGAKVRVEPVPAEYRDTVDTAKKLPR